MSDDIGREGGQGLERSCETGILGAPASPGLERIEARIYGEFYTPHRHDTYGLGVTLDGVQTFRYRGEKRVSTVGRVIVLHPDEVHDGAAGTEDGLRYRMLYLAPSLLRRAANGRQAALPFVADPVIDDPALRDTLLAALVDLDGGLDDLLVDDIVARIADGLSRHSGEAAAALSPTAWRAAEKARGYLVAHASRTVRSGELEAETGVDRFALARHFRAAFGTSPYRFQMMRRLERSRILMSEGEPLAGVAVETGFADQSHFTRMFKRAYGISPGRWALLVDPHRTRP